MRRKNYPAWLEAIGAAERTVHFESYIIEKDVAGRQFAELLAAEAQAVASTRGASTAPSDAFHIGPAARRGPRRGASAVPRVGGAIDSAFGCRQQEIASNVR